MKNKYVDSFTKIIGASKHDFIVMKGRVLWEMRTKIRYQDSEKANTKRDFYLTRFFYWIYSYFMKLCNFPSKCQTWPQIMYSGYCQCIALVKRVYRERAALGARLSASSRLPLTVGFFFLHANIRIIYYTDIENIWPSTENNEELNYEICLS